MKIVSWNLKNIGQTKLGNAFSPTFNAFGLGNNVLDYVSGLVMGTTRWNAVANLTTDPADIFVMIELKTGGHQKGRAVSGTCLPTINAVTAQLNVLSNIRYPNPNPPNPWVPPYVYAYATPVIVGYHETVGIIYNTRTLQLLSTHAFRNNTNQNWINPRTPFGSLFRVIGTQNTFQVIGIHAPPPKGAQALKYRPPIDYSNFLATTTPAGMTNSFFMGDFNCNPASSYTNGNGVVVVPFTGMVGFQTFIPNGTLSSVRTKVAGGLNPPANYLSDAYDNIMFNDPLVAANTQQLVVDMIGQARNMNAIPIVNVANTNLVAVLNAFNKVSDHLPVVIQA